MKIIVNAILLTGKVRELELPADYQVCPKCKGNGVVDPPHFADGWTSSEWDYEDDDFKADYMSGLYDVPCPKCAGERVTTKISDKVKLSARMKRRIERYEDLSRNRSVERNSDGYEY